MHSLQGKHILLTMSGGIAAFKVAELARSLIQEGATVQVIMSEAATKFMTPVTMQALTGNHVFTDQWDARISNNMAHIELSRKADVIVAAPASADLLAKISHGFGERSCQRYLFSQRVPIDCGACDEQANVGKRSHPKKYATTRSRRHHCAWPNQWHTSLR